MTQDWTPEGGLPAEFSGEVGGEPDDLSPETMTLPQLLERYAMLRDTVQGLEAEKEELGALIKQALAAGESAETDLYRAELKVSRRIEYPLDRFREVFGDAAALEAASIDRRKAEALARAGDLDGERLKNLAVSKEIQVLRLVPKTY
ncbi:hypothetical protein GCM10017783_16260 [Deinococcus piscis]|uniref:Uncharacterized protein n=1 Tax=Deinococcus piscis TaxID=394230 RepID=A0ABQ3K8K1_9DEIO|nr:hypothetical protein [Deinococcus piscis]GHG04396.1 hypothetical protein GCM10017783_16260 [Deinococcus piscis]